MKNSSKLVEAGWRIYVAWECDIKRSPAAVAEAIHLFAMSTGAAPQH
jgi:G:T-mismatch repair DNA endonuclease (very short patch repair protein)